MSAEISAAPVPVLYSTRTILSHLVDFSKQLVLIKVAGPDPVS